jgi:pimeloyl-ACP methyl ester carboxylesterase
MNSRRALFCLLLAVPLSACVPVEIQPNDVVRTNQSTVTPSGLPAIAAHVGSDYRFTSGEMPADFGKLHFVLAESDPHRPLIVSCGGNGFRENAGGAKTLEALAPFGNVLQFDYPGLGQSQGTGSKQDYDAALRAVHDKVEQLAAARGSSAVIFWGHSLGGGFCAALASGARVKSMLLMDGAFANLSDVVDGIVGGYSLFVRAEVQADTVEFDIPALLAGYNYPIIVVASKADEVIPFPVTARLAQKLKERGKNATFIELEGSAHGVIRRNPDYQTKVGGALGAFGIATTPLAAGASSAMDAKPCGAMHVRDGCGTLIWPDGSTYVGGFRGGLFHGHGTITYADGARFEGDYSDGNGHGQATYTKADGTVISGAFRDNKRDNRNTPQIEPPSKSPEQASTTTIVIPAIIEADGSITNAMAEIPPSLSGSDAARICHGATNLVFKQKWHPATIDGQPIKAPAFALITYEKAQ